MNKLSSIKKIGLVIIVIFIANFIANKVKFRLDLTSDKRYTLSETAINIIDDIKKPITIKVYLTGDFPSEFKRLEIETKQLLDEFKSEHKDIRFRFINPLDVDTQKLLELGMEPSELSVQEGGKVSEVIIFPWASVQQGKKIEIVSLLKDTNAQSQEEQLQSAIENLEYAFANAIHKINTSKNKKIAVLKGNNEAHDLKLYDLLTTLGDYYHLAQFTLDSVENNAAKTLQQLTAYDLILIAKPTKAFTEKEKYTLDQYIINGGKSLWMLDQVHAELDSLQQNGEGLAFPNDLKLTDLLFSYGVRINLNLVEDLYASTIPLASGKIGNQTQYNQFLWKYYPVTISKNNHAINKNIEPVNFKFTSDIDTLKNGIKKTILIQSSPLSRTLGTPAVISLNNIIKQPNPKDYNNGNKALAVLLEGNFSSAYANRVKPFHTELHKNRSSKNEMIVISDGDLGLNDFTQGRPDKLGYNKWTGQQFGNKEFLLNCINYLLDDSGLINLRSKSIDLRMLDKEKAYKERTAYQFINLALPLILLSLFGLVFTFYRKKKYS